MGHVRGTDEESISSNGDLERDLSSLKTIIALKSSVAQCVPKCATWAAEQVKKAPAPVLAEEAQLPLAPQWWAGCGEQRAMLLLVSQLLFLIGRKKGFFVSFS